MSKPSLGPFCECRKQCCGRNGLSKVKSSSSHVCDHGTKPKCSCGEQPKRRAGVCEHCIQDEPFPIPDPKRTASLMSVLKYDRSCNCKVVTRAVRADVHRYLGMIDHPRKYHDTSEDLEFIDTS